jgi:hypothetical protein
MSKIILVATTSAAQSDAVAVVDRKVDGLFMPAHFTAPGLAGAETATIQKKNADSSYSDIYVDGIIQNITPTNTGLAVYAPGIYRVDKGATNASVPIEVSTNEKP